MSDDLDLDKLDRVANEAEDAIAVLGDPAARLSRREFSDGIEATKKFSKTFNPPTVKRLIGQVRTYAGDLMFARQQAASSKYCKEFGCYQIRDGKNPSELQDERDQLKARVADLKAYEKVTVKTAQVEAWREAAEIAAGCLRGQVIVDFWDAIKKARALDSADGQGGPK